MSTDILLLFVCSYWRALMLSINFENFPTFNLKSKLLCRKKHIISLNNKNKNLLFHFWYYLGTLMLHMFHLTTYIVPSPHIACANNLLIKSCHVIKQYLTWIGTIPASTIKILQIYCTNLDIHYFHPQYRESSIFNKTIYLKIYILTLSSAAAPAINLLFIFCLPPFRCPLC